MLKLASLLLLVFLLVACGTSEAQEVSTTAPEVESVTTTVVETTIPPVETTTTTIPPTTTTTVKKLESKAPVIKSKPKSKVTADSSIWDQLAFCETHGNWAENSVPGYSGGLGFANQYWDNFGGLAFAKLPYLASREQQISVAERIHAANGWSAWPVCSKKLGLR